MSIEPGAGMYDLINKLEQLIVAFTIPVLLVHTGVLVKRKVSLFDITGWILLDIIIVVLLIAFLMIINQIYFYPRIIWI